MKFVSSAECQAGGSKRLRDSSSQKRVKQAERAQKMLEFTREQRLQAFDVLSPKSVLNLLSVRLEHLTELLSVSQLASLTSHGYCSISSDYQLRHQVGFTNVIATEDNGQTGIDEAAASTADGEDTVVRRTSKRSRNRKAVQQSSGGPEMEDSDCLVSVKLSSLAESLSYAVTSCKSSLPTSADVAISETVLTTVLSENDMKMASVDQSCMASSSLNKTVEKDDDVDLLGKEVEQIEDQVCHGALGDEGTSCDAGTVPELRQTVNDEDVSTMNGTRDTSTTLRLDQAATSAADGEDTVVRRTSKRSRKRKVVQQSSGGPEMEDNDCLESEKQSCHAESLSSAVTSSKSSLLTSADVAISQTALNPATSENVMEMTVGHGQTSLDQNLLASSSLNKTVEKDDDVVELLGKETQQTEDEVTTSVNCHIIESWTQAPADREQFYGSLCVTSRAADQRENGVLVDGAADGDRGPDDVWTSYRGHVDVGGTRRCVRRRRTSCLRGGMSTSPGLEPEVREQGNGWVRRRCGRPRGSRRARAGRRSSANPFHYHDLDVTSHDDVANDIASSNCTSYLRRLSAVPFSGVDVSNPLHDASAAAYTGVAKHRF